MKRVVTIVLAVMALVTTLASPLSAQRSADARVGVAYVAARPVSAPQAQGDSGWDGMQPWARHAIIGGAIGGLGGWLLSGMPCEGAQGSCHSAASSIVAGAAIGAIVGALWSFGGR